MPGGKILTNRILSCSLTAKTEGRPCEYNSRIYQNGESFQPNCKHQCTCIDGAVGCIPLCPQELSLPTLGCANPRLVKVPGKCCEKWVCDDATKLEHSDKLLGKDTVLDETESDLTNRNELVANVKHGLKSLAGRCYSSSLGPCFGRLFNSFKSV